MIGLQLTLSFFIYDLYFVTIIDRVIEVFVNVAEMGRNILMYSIHRLCNFRFGSSHGLYLFEQVSVAIKTGI